MLLQRMLGLHKKTSMIRPHPPAEIRQRKGLDIKKNISRVITATVGWPPHLTFLARETFSCLPRPIFVEDRQSRANAHSLSKLYNLTREYTSISHRRAWARTYLVVVDRVRHSKVDAAGAVRRHGPLLRPRQTRLPEVLPGAVAGAAHPHLLFAAALQRGGAIGAVWVGFFGAVAERRGDMKIKQRKRERDGEMGEVGGESRKGERERESDDSKKARLK